MPSREHQSGNVRIKVSTIHTNLAGSFIEWGGEAWRDRRYRIASDWWNPFTWGRYEWRREGSPEITAVEFFRSSGDVISGSLLNPQGVSEPGYQKVSCVYWFVSVGRGHGVDDLGNDARSVANVTIRYDWNGTSHALSDH